MIGDVPNELLYEILKQIRDDARRIRQCVDALEEQCKNIRHMLVALQETNDLRHETTVQDGG